MKSNRSLIILALSTILIGALLIAFPANATKWLVMAIGALFLVPGIVGVATYIMQQRKGAESQNRNDKQDDRKDKNAKKSKNIFPFIGIGSILFGSILLLMPSKFQNALLYILGAFLVLAGLAQIYRFLQLRKQYKLSATPYIVSSLISVAGIVVILLNHNGGALPIKAGSQLSDSPTYWPSMIFGVASLVLGISEIIYAIQFRKSDKTVPSDNLTISQQDEVNEAPQIASPEPEETETKPQQPEEIGAKQQPEDVGAGQQPESTPSFQVPEYTTTANNTMYAASDKPKTANPTIEAEVDSET